MEDNMNFLPMYYFTVVTEKESINKAAQKLHITQQTLSAHMAAIEKELNCTLFYRRPRFSLTYAGEKFYQYARGFIRMYDTMLKEFADISGSESGTISVGIGHTRSRVLMPEILPSFCREYPFIQVNIKEQRNDTLLQNLFDGNADLIIGDIPRDMPEIEVRPLYREKMQLVIPKSLLHGEFSPSALGELPFILGAPHDIAGRIGREFLKQHGAVPPAAASSDNMETILAMCLRGAGASFCSDLILHETLSREDLDKLLVIPLKSEFEIKIAWLRREYLPRHMALFIQHAENNLAELYSS